MCCVCVAGGGRGEGIKNEGVSHCEVIFSGGKNSASVC